MVKIKIKSIKVNMKINQEITVTAKCPKCKKKKEYKMPINFTPYCDKCLGVPMIISTVKIKTLNP